MIQKIIEIKHTLVLCVFSLQMLNCKKISASALKPTADVKQTCEIIMIIKSAYTKSSFSKTAIAAGLERLLNLHTYKKYTHMGGGNFKHTIGRSVI